MIRQPSGKAARRRIVALATSGFPDQARGGRFMMMTRKTVAVAVGALVVSGLVGASALPVNAASTPTPPTCAHQLKVVKSAWSKAAAGPKKDEAKVHYDNAVADHKKKDDKSCLSELTLASAALK
jgi:hypothetical protein